MMMSENLLLFILLLISLPKTSQATKYPICSPSSCGIIRNISFPFRLKHDPQHCGHPDYELECENSVTIVYLNSQKYRVKEINYHNLTISLVDVSINSTNTCSFPNYSAYQYNFKYGPYTTHESYLSIGGYDDFPDVAWPINFMSCPHPLNNTDFTKSNCVNGTTYNYIKVGHMNASDVGDMCRIDMIVMTSWKFEDLKNVSVSEIHESLLHGFQLSWFRYPCINCKDTCTVDENYNPICYSEWPSVLTQIVVIIVIGLLLAGISLGNILMTGVALFLVISFLVFLAGLRMQQMIVGIGIVGIKFIIVFPGVLLFLIYKFRRRHLSMFNEIEDFLQSDNKIMPIRYSYSDIKKMTRGFREKLGQGGYGTVYKGKLQSGYNVAIKVLGKARENDQDFFNEMTTIGRIHHINVARLVGYFAERSKRALVFDFMPNGSLDKYIYSQEKMYCLSWERKYEIAIGVARGIEYLHRGCDIQILHFDIKPHNILLDDNFTPKITDFGLAKFYSTEKNTVTLSAARGTVGYVAPELINRGFGRVSFKADIYSFGMLLIEMVCLKKDLTRNGENSSQYFPDWIYDSFDQGWDIEIGKSDEEDGNDDTRKIARKMTIVALWCIQMSPDNRPSMSKVIEMLEGEVEHLQIPQRPTKSTQVVLGNDQSWSTSSTEFISLLPHDPSFEITIQEL